jgi:hypothetical protein
MVYFKESGDLGCITLAGTRRLVRLPSGYQDEGHPCPSPQPGPPRVYTAGACPRTCPLSAAHLSTLTERLGLKPIIRYCRNCADPHGCKQPAPACAAA